MKVLVYGFREDETQELAKAAADRGIETVTIRENLNRQNVEEAAGFTSIAINAGSLMDRQNLERLTQLGVKYIATRSIGFDNIDLDACRELGLKVANVRYSAHSVADYAVLLMLMLMVSSAVGGVSPAAHALMHSSAAHSASTRTKDRFFFIPKTSSGLIVPGFSRNAQGAPLVRAVR